MASDLTVRVETSIADIERSVWDSCANPFALAGATACRPSANDPFNPFVAHDFLAALESSGCVGARTGWAPAHVVVTDNDGTVLACAATYLKSHSRGEYVFDRGWAEAYERAGGQYYPKLQVSVPFTPVTGPRLLVVPGPRAELARQTLVAGLRALRNQLGASSTHVTFLSQAEWEVLAAAGYLRRTDQQFHFANEGYASFEDFLGALASRKRKMIRRERRDALAAGIEIERLTGSAITESHWDAFYEFYMDTGSRKWGSPYLNRAFFSQIGTSMSDHILLVMAKREGRYIAGAINFIGAEALYGRNWGCIEHHPMLHFEVCYYQAIEFAIERKLVRVEAGAQGEHKLARGYRPVTTYSAHDIADPGLRKAIADYLVRERAYVEETHELLADHVPFRRDQEREMDSI